MKLHLPLNLRKALLAVFGALSCFSATLQAAPTLTLGNEDTLSIDYTEESSIQNMENGILQLNGSTILLLSDCGVGDGKTYTLFTGVAGLLDEAGNVIALDSTNNAISNYFDTTLPGTGFWADATIQLLNDGTLRFVCHSENVESAVTITTRLSKNVDYQYHSVVAFEDIECIGEYTWGGAIENSGIITLSHNGSVTFSGNTVAYSGKYISSLKGGAIQGYESDITLDNNGSVTFIGNAATYSSTVDAAYVEGGAIEAYYSSNVLLTDNGTVAFIGNAATSSSTNYTAYAEGGAIEASHSTTVSLTDNGTVAFTENTATSSSTNYTASAEGGAIYAQHYSTVLLTDNGTVAFTENTATSSSTNDTAYAKGGAIDAYYSSNVLLTDNGTVTFDGNSAASFTYDDSSSYSLAYTEGGAIRAYYNSAVLLDNNGSVLFNENKASAFAVDPSCSVHAYGGAIYTYVNSDVTLSNNGSVVFCRNEAYSCFERAGNISGFSPEAGGGAIYAWSDCDIVLNYNGNVTFCDNRASSVATMTSGCYSKAFGGAVYVYGDDNTIVLNDNGRVTFSGNMALTTGKSSYTGAYGGAIYTEGNLNIQNNESVLFEKNAEVMNGSYRLRSIYVDGGGISLSAAMGKSIEFRDSVYIDSGSEVHLNGDYTAADGVVHRQQGDIIFTGAYAEAHLNELLVRDEVGRSATEDEILASRTTDVKTMTSLYGGRLRVENGAIFAGRGITVHEGSAATVLVKDATLSHSGYTLSFNSGTTLELSGINTISAANMRLNDGAGFVFNVDDIHLTTAALSYTGALTLGGELVICINSKEGLINGNTYKLMTVTDTSTTEAISWGSTNITIQAGDGLEVGSDDLIWVENVLYLNYSGISTVKELKLTWLGGKKAVWQTDNETLWMNALGDKVVYRDGDLVTFTQDTIEIVGEVQPSSITLAPVKSLTFKTKYNKKAGEWSGSIGGEGISVTIAGGAKGKVTMNDGNTYTGITSIESGTVNVGGATSFGKSSIVISGGTLDLKSKAVANEIELTGSATIKGGKKYLGTYSQTGGELMKGSVLNVAEEATLTGGVVNGTLSGEGTVTVDGDVELGTTGKITTDKLLVDGTFFVSNKGLAMNAKTSSITVEAGGQLISEGALKSAALTVDGGVVELHSAKKSSIAITNNMRLRNGADVTAFANVKAANLLMTGAQLTLGQTESDIRESASSVASSLTAKGNVVLTSSALTLGGKISTGNLTVIDSYVNMTSGKLQTIAVKNTLTLSGDNSFIFDFDAKDGKSYKLFTFKYFISDGTALHELLGWDANDSYTLTANAKNITLKVNDAEAWEAYMDTLASGEAVATLSEDDELVESAGAQVLVAPADVDPMLGKVADTLVQSTWGTAGASRAFADTIAARGTHATEFANGKGTAWISTMGGSSRISSDGGHAGADYTLTGAAFGMEARLSDSSTIGLSIGNSWGKVSTFSAFPVDQDSTHQGIYGKHLLGCSTTLSWMAAHTRTESDANLAGMACDWTQDALQLDARVDKLFAIGDRTTVSAFVGMQYLATDKGECNGLSTGSLQNLRGEIGVSAAHKATDKAYVYGELSFIGDMVRHNPTATVGDYRSRGANPGRAGLNLSVGASYQLNDSWSLNGSYNLELMQNQTSHSANVGATYSF